MIGGLIVDFNHQTMFNALSIFPHMKHHPAAVGFADVVGEATATARAYYIGILGGSAAADANLGSRRKNGFAAIDHSRHQQSKPIWVLWSSGIVVETGAHGGSAGS